MLKAKKEYIWWEWPLVFTVEIAENSGVNFSVIILFESLISLLKIFFARQYGNCHILQYSVTELGVS